MAIQQVSLLYCQKLRTVSIKKAAHSWDETHTHMGGRGTAERMRHVQACQEWHGRITPEIEQSLEHMARQGAVGRSGSPWNWKSCSTFRHCVTCETNENTRWWCTKADRTTNEGSTRDHSPLTSAHRACTIGVPHTFWSTRSCPLRYAVLWKRRCPCCACWVCRPATP